MSRAARCVLQAVRQPRLPAKLCEINLLKLVTPFLRKGQTRSQDELGAGAVGELVYSAAFDLLDDVAPVVLVEDLTIQINDCGAVS